MGVRGIHTGHADLIHDFTYDFYGKRLATCSSDQVIKIWKKMGRDWRLQQELHHQHHGSIQRISWAHPKFGDIIASCASDYNIHVFVSTGSTFAYKTQLSKPKDIIRDCQFAPEHYRLALASASADGTVQFWEAEDITDLRRWDCRHSITVGRKANCLSWNPSKYETASLAIGSSENITVWAFDSKANNWFRAYELYSGSDVITVHWAPNLGRRYHLIAFGCRHPNEPLRVAKIIDQNVEIFELVDHEEESPATCWRVCWNITGTLLACSLDNGKTIVWKHDSEEGWTIALRNN